MMLAAPNTAESTEISVRGVRYRLAPLRGAELAPVVPLLRTTYRRRDFTARWLSGKYAGEFAGVSGFSYVALTDAGEAVAACGMLPWPIRYRDRIEIGVQVVDAATHRDHRRRGLFRTLAELAHARCVAQGAAFFFAFPHRGGDSYPGFVGTLGYSDIGRHVEYRRRIRTLWAERVTRRVGLGGPYRRHVDRVLGALTPDDRGLDNSLVHEGYAATARDAAFHRYKSFAGSRVVQLDGGRVWLKVRHGIQIGDVEARTPRDIERSMLAVDALGRRLGVHQIVLHAPPGSRLEEFVASRWPSTASVSVVHRDVRSRIPPERLRFSLGDLDNF